MKFTQKQINEMEMAELLDNIELAIEEKEENEKAMEELKPRLIEVLLKFVEIEEAVEENEGLQVNIVRADKESL